MKALMLRRAERRKLKRSRRKCKRNNRYKRKKIRRKKSKRKSRPRLSPNNFRSKMTTKIICLLMLVVFLFWSIDGISHPGRTDKNGGHTEKKTGLYHFHNKKKETH